MSMLEIQDLTVTLGDRVLLDGVSLSVAAGQVLGLVGESGSGKSLTSLAVLGLLPSSMTIRSGSIRFEGQELVGASEDVRQKLRGDRIAMIFQDPLAALNPVMRIGDQIGEVLIRRHGYSRARAHDRVIQLMERVGIPEPQKRMRAYPHEFSGGLRQRAVIAMAVACGPSLLLADEPTTALDVSVQRTVLDLLRQFSVEDNMSMILVSHDLRVVSHYCQHVAVMRHGKIVEQGSTEQVITAPQHDYTRKLLSLVPRVGVTNGEVRP